MTMSYHMHCTCEMHAPCTPPTDTAVALLVSRPGALPRLLRHAASPAASPQLKSSIRARALTGFTSAGQPSLAQVTSSMLGSTMGAVASGWQYEDGSTHVEAYLSDLQELVEMVGVAFFVILIITFIRSLFLHARRGICILCAFGLDS